MRSLRERFEEKVPDRPAVGCWPWGASLCRGYGQIMLTRSDGSHTMGRAYRVAYELFIGPVPEGLEVEHVCENKACVRWTVDPGLGGYRLAAVTHRANLARTALSKPWYGEYQRRKTHCPQGHPYSVENTYRYGSSRMCKTCACRR